VKTLKTLVVPESKQRLVDETEKLVDAERHNKKPTLVWLDGISTSNLADGEGFSSHLIFRCTRTKRYATLLGSKTVYVLEPLNAEFPAD